MMKFALICLSVFMWSWSASGEDLFKYKKEVYNSKNIDPSYKLKLFDAENDYFRARQRIVENAVIDLYAKNLAKAQNKSSEEVKKSLFEVGEPSEADLKKFYEENQRRIPYPFEQIKSKLVQVVKEEARSKKFEEIVEKIKKSNDYESFLKEPVAPRIDLAVSEFPGKGKSNSSVTVVEFADYRCPHCREAFLIMKDVLKKYGDKINFVFVDFPIMGDSEKIARGAHCADKQKKYWDYHNLAYEKQGVLKEAEEFAKELKLDEATFKKCLDSGATKAIVDQGKAEGERVGVTGTPTIFINGYRYSDGYEKEAMMKAISDALSGKKYAS